MTEVDWLAGTDPAAMWRHVEPMATERQWRYFVEAFRKLWVLKGGQNRPWSILSLPPYDQLVTAQERCAIIRDIFGNPFRPLPPLRQPIRRTVFASVGIECEHGYDYCPKCDWKDSEFGLDVKSWLAWNDGIVAKLARQIVGGETCDACDGVGGQGAWVGNQWPAKCGICHGTGKTPPDWSLMPILADALEEAGCQEQEILMHCRGKERCPNCFDLTKPIMMEDVKSHRMYPVRCVPCNDTGLIPLRGPHMRGCFVIELILGGE